MGNDSGKLLRMRRHMLGRAARFGLDLNHASPSTSSRPSVAALLAVGEFIERMEPRLLLSAYTLSELAYLGTNATGANPQSTLAVDAGGNLYGTATGGGTYGFGTVFQVAHGSSAVTTLASFNDTDCADPYAGPIVDPTGNIFGTTVSGGASGAGTVFEVPSGSTSITTLVSFQGSNGNGPFGGVVLDETGNLYGTTQFGGANNDGTVFEMASGSMAVTTLASFNGTNGTAPEAGLTLDTTGDLFGTTSRGGSSNAGTAFEIPYGSGTITTLASFAAGEVVLGNVVLDSSGDLYGASAAGGTNRHGLVFEIAAGSGAATTLASFTDANGAEPEGGLTRDTLGDLFGTTTYGGSSSDGAVFEIAGGSSAITSLATFNGSNGRAPLGSVSFDSSGNLYGTTQFGGANDCGAVFEIASKSGTATAIASFAPVSGASPEGGLTSDAGGNLYGASARGGPSNAGTVFAVGNGSNVVTTLATFDKTNGGDPNRTLTFDAFGNLYGTTFVDGAYGYGTVFEIAKGSATITTLVSFNDSNGASPNSGLVIDSSGNIFGTTSGGGGSGALGTAFEIAKGSSQATTLAVFKGTSNGSDPMGPLALDASGNLYGATGNGGASGDGTVFEIAKGASTVTTLATFSGGSGGFWPHGGITVDALGDLYGTTEDGGTSNDGTVFEIAKGSTVLTTLASFDGADGVNPESALTFDPSGNLFGTTLRGGALGYGTAFEIGKGGDAITTLASFSYADGNIYAGLMLDQFGELYGESANSGGALFELTPNASITLAAQGPNPSTVSESLAFLADVSGGVNDGQTVTLLDANNGDAVIATGTISNGSATLTVPRGTLSPGTHNLIAVYAGDGNFAACESSELIQTVNSDPLPSYVMASAGAAFGYDAVTGSLNLTSGTVTFTADNTAAPLINLTAAGPASGVFFDTSEHLSGLTLSGGAQATMLSLGSARTHSNHDVLVIGTPGAASDPTFSIDPSSKLDLQDNDLIVHTGTSDSTGQSELAAVRALAATGRNVPAGSVLNGSWTGNGLTSSSAASVDSKAGLEQNVLAVVLNSDQLLGADTKWTVGSASESVGAHDVLVKYTYNGDAALEGYVGDDSVTIVNGLYDGGKSTQADWAFGDFTGNGKVDDNDITILNGLYGNGTAASGLPQL